MGLFEILLCIALAGQPRQILIFYNESGKNLADSQLLELKQHSPALVEREIETKSYTNYKADPAWKQWNVDVSQPFTCILIGRDGGEKFRANRIVKAKEFFALVDAMPMRKSEMREKGRKD